jgi:hypothetical protein
MFPTYRILSRFNEEILQLNGATDERVLVKYKFVMKD